MVGYLARALIHMCLIISSMAYKQWARCPHRTEDLAWSRARGLAVSRDYNFTTCLLDIITGYFNIIFCFRTDRFPKFFLNFEEESDSPRRAVCL